MKKKLILTSLALIMGLSLAFAAAEHHYNFFLSCGKTVFMTFESELSAKQLLSINGCLESTLCPSPDESEFDPS